MISFDKALGIYQHALPLLAERSELIMSNLANAETPGYKARDIDFKATLAEIDRAMSAKGASSSVRQGRLDDALDAEIKYRIPLQPSNDGNTVDPHIERAEFTKTSLQYLFHLNSLSGTIKSLRSAIRGE